MAKDKRNFEAETLSPANLKLVQKPASQPQDERGEGIDVPQHSRKLINRLIDGLKQS